MGVGKEENVGMSSSLETWQVSGRPGMKLEQTQRGEERCWPRSCVCPADGVERFKSNCSALKGPPRVLGILQEV